MSQRNTPVSAEIRPNADYNERRGVVFLWQEDGLKLSNPGGFRVSIEDACTGGNSDPRNETMMKMFSLVHVGERAGSGIPNMMKNWLDAGYDRPMLSEQVNPERSTIFLPLTQVPAPKKWTKKVDEKSGRKVGKAEMSRGLILALVGQDGPVSRSQVVAATGLSPSWVSKQLSGLVAEGRLVAEGTGRSRKYRLKED